MIANVGSHSVEERFGDLAQVGDDPGANDMGAFGGRASLSGPRSATCDACPQWRGFQPASVHRNGFHIVVIHRTVGVAGIAAERSARGSRRARQCRLHHISAAMIATPATVDSQGRRPDGNSIGWFEVAQGMPTDS